MKKSFIIICSLIILCLIWSCNKQDQEIDPKPAEYFCSDRVKMADTSSIRQYFYGSWKLKASYGGMLPPPYPISFVEESAAASYLIIYPDSTYANYKEGNSIIKRPSNLQLNPLGSSFNMGSLWFCDTNTLIISNVSVDGPVLRFERIQ